VLSGSDSARETLSGLRVRTLIVDIQETFSSFRLRSDSYLQNRARKIIDRVSYFSHLKVLIFYDVDVWKEGLNTALHDAARATNIDLSELELVFLDFMWKGGIDAALRGWIAKKYGCGKYGRAGPLLRRRRWPWL